MTASIYVETSGCSFNVSDGEAMAGVLLRSGYRIAPSAEAADLIVLNTCTVKDRTFLNFRKRLAELRRLSGDGPPKPLVIAGCVPKAYEKTDLLQGVSTLGPDQVGRIDEVVRETLRGRVVSRLARSGAPGRSSLPVHRRNPVIEILPIARGCRSACTFCQTRIARGRLASFAPKEIVAQARRALDEGVAEFWVTAQDTGVYGRDVDTTLAALLGELLELPGDFRVRLGMSSPRWIAESLEEILDIFENPKMFRFLHIPVQSGSERVLAHMRRDGTAHEFEAIHEKFLARFPEATVMTDIIAGYPTETEEDFETTLALLRRVKLPCVNCSKFSARSGTAAARVPQLHSSVLSARSKRLTRLVRRLADEYHRERVGRRFSVLIDHLNADGSRLGRTDSYRPVLVRERAPLGSKVDVDILRGEPFRFFGRVVPTRDRASSQAAPAAGLFDS